MNKRNSFSEANWRAKNTIISLKPKPNCHQLLGNSIIAIKERPKKTKKLDSDI